MRGFLLAVVAACLALPGCVQDRGLAGVWSGEVSIAAAQGSAEDQFAGDIAQALSDSIELEFELREDGSYRERVLFFEVEGRWESKGGRLALKPEKVNGESLSALKDAKAREELGATKVFEVKEGGQALVRANEDGSYREVFTRKAE